MTELRGGHPMEKSMPRRLSLTIFLTALATLALETALTRIFSVTMWYHYAFMAVSVAMLGMATGAAKVFVSRWAALEETELVRRIGRYGLSFAVATVVSLLALLSIPFVPRPSGVGIAAMALIYVVAAIPFYFSGVIVSAILSTRFIALVNRLYAADLAGAAAGAVLFFLFLRVTDGVSFILLIAALPALASWLLLRRPAVFLLVLGLAGLGIFNHEFRFFRIEWQKVETGQLAAVIDTQTEWEKWTPFSRITVAPASDLAFSWGVSGAFAEDFPGYRIGQKNLVIDAAAATIITRNDRPVADLQHLRYDITNLAHFLVPNARVAVIGVGGGRDLLSALHFDQKEVWGIEINDRILEAITGPYRKYTYPFTADWRIHLIHDEARSFIERTKQRFDIIQASLIDSWAATASGAFVLTENSLYTVEGWRVFLSKLTDRGVVTMSRWYYKKRPGELLRLASLAYEALDAAGVKNPAEHILLAATAFSGAGEPGLSPEEKKTREENAYGTGTIIVSRSPWNAEAVRTFLSVCARYRFEVLLAAGKEGVPAFLDIVDRGRRPAMIAAYPLDLRAPTDDRPFFFNMLKPSALVTQRGIEREGPLSTNLGAVRNLLILLVIVTALALVLIVAPILSAMKGRKARMLFHPWSLYFAAIGLGFMLIEIALIQKFTVFLGHPTYSLLVVLCTILLFTGIGSGLSGRRRFRPSPGRVFLPLLAVAAAAGGVNMFVLPLLSGWPLAARIGYSAAIMAGIGLVLGMPFPTGMAALSGEKKEWGPWLWGINGALGVVSSVLATAISLFFGISVTFFAGIAAYLLAFLAGLAATRSERLPAAE